MRATFLLIERGLLFLIICRPVAFAAASEGCSTKRWNESALSVFSES
jgi:hypothetical protein